MFIKGRSSDPMDLDLVEQLSQSILGEEEGHGPQENELRGRMLETLTNLRQQIQLRNLRQSASPETPARPRGLRRVDRTWKPPAIELSPEFCASRRDEEVEQIKQALTPMYETMEREIRDIRNENRTKRIWKTDPEKKVSTAPFMKSDRASWVNHRYISPGWQKYTEVLGDVNRKFNPYQFDDDYAEFLFRGLHLPENERTLATRKQLLIDYMNHHVCVIRGRKKPYYCIRMSDPEGGVYIDRKSDLKDVIIYFHRKVYCRDPNEAEEGKPAKPMEMGKLWSESGQRLTFHNEIFDPQLYYLKLNQDPQYDPRHDESMNTFKGIAVSPARAAKFHHQLYYRLIRPIYDPYEKQYFDRRPCAGWFHPIFVDRSNFTFFNDLFDDIKIGDIMTQYHAIPERPYARGPAWMKNPFWEEDHLPLQLKLREYNLNYYFEVPPKKLAFNVMSTDPKEREEEIFNMWFNNPHQPYHDAGPSVAPILQWIWEALCGGCNEENYSFIMKWLATWRTTFEPGGVTTALILRSAPGTGKTSFVKMLGAMIGERYFMETNDTTDIFGYFTTSVDEKLLLFLDEFKVNKPDDMRKLKALATGTHVRQRAMQRDAVQVKKWFSTIMCANKYMVLFAEPGERRWVFLELPDSLCGCKNYLTALQQSLFTKEGKFEFSGDRTYNQNVAGAGVVLFAHYLDNWPRSETISILQVPQNALLYLHQVASLESVAAWWFEKLRRGMTMESNALDDWMLAPVRDQRLELKLMEEDVCANFVRNYEQAITSPGQKSFTDHWMAKHSTDGRLDWQKVVQSMMRPLQHGPRSKIYTLVSGTPYADAPRIWVFVAIRRGLLTVPQGTALRFKNKWFRGHCYAYIFEGTDGWERYLYKPALYNLYLNESNRVEQKTFTRFFEELKQLGLWGSQSRVACSMSFNKRVFVTAQLPVDRVQVSGFSLPPGSQNHPSHSPRMEAPTQRVYLKLDTLYKHRRAFWEFMRWDLRHWNDVWDPKTGQTATKEKPWHLFGDNKFY